MPFDVVSYALAKRALMRIYVPDGVKTCKTDGKITICPEAVEPKNMYRDIVGTVRYATINYGACNPPEPTVNAVPEGMHTAISWNSCGHIHVAFWLASARTSKLSGIKVRAKLYANSSFSFTEGGAGSGFPSGAFFVIAVVYDYGAKIDTFHIIDISLGHPPCVATIDGGKYICNRTITTRYTGAYTLYDASAAGCDVQTSTCSYSNTADEIVEVAPAIDTGYENAEILAIIHTHSVQTSSSRSVDARINVVLRMKLL